MDADTVLIWATNVAFIVALLWFLGKKIASVEARFRGIEELPSKAPEILKAIDYKAAMEAIPFERWLAALAANPVGVKSMEAIVEAAAEGIYESTKAAMSGKTGAERAAGHKAFGKVVNHITDTLGLTPILNAIGLDPKANPVGVMQLSMQLFGPQINAWIGNLQKLAEQRVGQATTLPSLPTEPAVAEANV